MRVSISFALTAALSLVSVSNSLKILLNNDDGFASGNLRELYRILKGAGHDVVLVAPVNDQSGMGGRAVFSALANLTTASEFNIIPAGAPAIGNDPNDSNVWYYNGTPAACTFVGLDYVIPRYKKNWGSPDLLLSGPNFGTNLGPFLYTLSGTIGATYAAVERGIPAIAFSASNAFISVQNVTNTTNPATYAAAAAYKVAKQFIDATPTGQSVLPLGYGVNVNIPVLTNSTVPPIVASRLTGEADVDTAVYNETSGIFTYGNASPKSAGINVAYNGNPNLPGETYVEEGGAISVSVFTVDYDAPSNDYTASVFAKLKPITSSSAVLKKRGVVKKAYVRREPSD